MSVSSRKGLPSITVSLTSYPPRIGSVDRVVQNMLAQTLKPDRVVLWLAEDQFPKGLEELPYRLKKLTSEGLEIRWCEDWKSYKKLVPSLTEFPEDIIITVDDDLVYDEKLVETLVDSYIAFPDAVSTVRTHLMRFNTDGTLCDYKDWRMDYQNSVGEPGMCLFATTGAGTLFPPHVFGPEAADPERFMTLCPKADDIWVKVMQVYYRVPTVLARRIRPLKYIPDTQTTTLFEYNLRRGGNDTQLRAALDYYNAKLEGETLERRLVLDSPGMCPEFAVIIPYCGGGTRFARLMDGIKAQTRYGVRALCVCADGYERGLAEKYVSSDGRTVIINVPADSSITARIAAGMKYAQDGADYFIILTDRDTVKPEAFKQIYDQLARTPCRMLAMTGAVTGTGCADDMTTSLAQRDGEAVNITDIGITEIGSDLHTKVFHSSLRRVAAPLIAGAQLDGLDAERFAARVLMILSKDAALSERGDNAAEGIPSEEGIPSQEGIITSSDVITSEDVITTELVRAFPAYGMITRELSYDDYPVDENYIIEMNRAGGQLAVQSPGCRPWLVKMHESIFTAMERAVDKPAYYAKLREIFGDALTISRLLRVYKDREGELLGIARKSLRNKTAAVAAPDRLMIIDLAGSGQLDIMLEACLNTVSSAALVSADARAAELESGRISVSLLGHGEINDTQAFFERIGEELSRYRPDAVQLIGSMTPEMTGIMMLPQTAARPVMLCFEGGEENTVSALPVWEAAEYARVTVTGNEEDAALLRLLDKRAFACAAPEDPAALDVDGMTDSELGELNERLLNDSTQKRVEEWREAYRMLEYIPQPQTKEQPLRRAIRRITAGFSEKSLRESIFISELEKETGRLRGSAGAMRDNLSASIDDILLRAEEKRQRMEKNSAEALDRQKRYSEGRISSLEKMIGELRERDKAFMEEKRSLNDRIRSLKSSEDRTRRELEEIKASSIYRAGLIVTWLPRKAVILLRRLMASLRGASDDE